MAENDFFVEEVSADVRKEGANRIFHKYRFVLLGIVVGAVGLVAINEFRGSRQDQAQMESFQALSALQENKADASDRAILESSDSEIIALELARELRDQGDHEGAIAAYGEILDNKGFTQTSRDLAALEIASLKDGSDFGVLSNPDAPFRAQAKLLEIDALIGAGDHDGAKAVLIEILNDPQSSGAHGFAERVFLALGGDIGALDAQAEASEEIAEDAPIEGENNDQN